MRTQPAEPPTPEAGQTRSTTPARGLIANVLALICVASTATFWVFPGPLLAFSAVASLAAYLLLTAFTVSGTVAP